MPEADRRRDLLLTAVMLGIVLTPAWLTPDWISWPWRVVTILVGLPALWLSWRHAPWHPTPEADMTRLLPHLQLKPGDHFGDLGAGDGRVVVRVARATGAQCTGLEGSPLPWLVAQWRTLGVPGARVRLADLYQADLRDYDALYVWGTAYSVSQPAFTEAILAHARPGARLVSYHHPVHGLVPVAVDPEGQRPFYVYEVPSTTDPT